MPSPPDPVYRPSQGTPRASLPDDALPQVEAPNAGFILQLFLIPMMIVAIIVTVWLMFSWLAQMGSNPVDLVKGLKRGDDAAWQKAGILADMLRDKRKEHLKHDPALAREIAAILNSQIQEGSKQQHQIKLRIFLCRALGEFRVAEVLPSLLTAATTERDQSEIQPADSNLQSGNSRQFSRNLTELDVRRAALEAIAVLVTNVREVDFRDDEQLLKVLVEASGERGDPARDEYLRRELRSTAAYVLGVLGGDRALASLHRVLDDSYPNARFNAATGLARHGDIRAVPELVDMLDPDNQDVVKDEQHDSGKEFKRSLVITNAVRAAVMLAEENQSADLEELELALAALASSDAHFSVRAKAKEASEVFQKRQAAGRTKSPGRAGYND